MWISLGFVAALSLASAGPGELTLSDVHFTHGVLGPARVDDAFLPGDSLTLAFTINGLRADDAGRVRYALATEVRNGREEVQLSEHNPDIEAIAALGGGCVPGYAQVTFGVHQAPGAHTLKVTVTDQTGKRSQSLERQFQVLPPAFGVVRVTTTEASGSQPVGVLGPGQELFVNALAVGFARDNDRHQPDLIFEMRVLDMHGQPTLAKPFTGTVRENVPERATSVPVQFQLSLNRPGKFTVELTAVDGVGHHRASSSFPLVVPAP